MSEVDLKKLIEAVESGDDVAMIDALMKTGDRFVLKEDEQGRVVIKAERILGNV